MGNGVGAPLDVCPLLVQVSVGERGVAIRSEYRLLPVYLDSAPVFWSGTEALCVYTDSVMWTCR